MKIHLNDPNPEERAALIVLAAAFEKRRGSGGRDDAGRLYLLADFPEVTDKMLAVVVAEHHVVARLPIVEPRDDKAAKGTRLPPAGPRRG